jgi:hypothetical protein
MKKLITLVMTVLVLAYVNNVHAYEVNVISSNFSTSGDINGRTGDYPYTPFSDSYSQSGFVPLSNGVTNGSGQNATTAQSSAGFFSVSAFGVASNNNMCTANASATANWTFQPLSSIDHLTINYDFGSSAASHTASNGNYTLTDTTTGTTISSKNLSQPPLFSRTGWTGSDLINYSFQTDHIYGLALSANATSTYDGRTLTIWTNNIAAVPQGDFPPADCDVDGSDLAALIANTSLIDLATFAQNFGKNFCP